MKYKFGLISLALLLLGSLLFGSHHVAASFASILPGFDSAPKIPDSVLYESVFRLDLDFHRKAREQELAGKAVTPLINYFKEQFNLTDEENDLLHKTALDFAEAVRPIDKRANEIVDGIRKQFPNGVVKDPQSVPPPPPELGELQARRDALALDYRDRLHYALGSEKFETVDELVKNEFAKNFEAINDFTNTRRGQ